MSRNQLRVGILILFLIAAWMHGLVFASVMAFAIVLVAGGFIAEPYIRAYVTEFAPESAP